jgi:hypothetical protein
MMTCPQQSLNMHSFVIPANAGIQVFQRVAITLDSGFHRSDDLAKGSQS